ncbi:MAG: hypothetical protein ABEJ56_04195 [Candidatus Nanohaloarchaea archaeon]
MSEKIGRHKGALQTLLHEKKELSRILKIVNSQIERHLSELEDEGVDTERLMDQITGKESSSGNREHKSRGQEEPENPGEMLESEEERDFGDRDFSPT